MSFNEADHPREHGKFAAKQTSESDTHALDPDGQPETEPATSWIVKDTRDMTEADVTEMVHDKSRTLRENGVKGGSGSDGFTSKESQAFESLDSRQQAVAAAINHQSITRYRPGDPIVDSSIQGLAPRIQRMPQQDVDALYDKITHGGEVTPDDVPQRRWWKFGR